MATAAAKAALALTKTAAASTRTTFGDHFCLERPLFCEVRKVGGASCINWHVGYALTLPPVSASSVKLDSPKVAWRTGKRTGKCIPPLKMANAGIQMRTAAGNI